MYIVIKHTDNNRDSGQWSDPHSAQGGFAKNMKSKLSCKNWSSWARVPGESRHQLTTSRNVILTLTRGAALWKVRFCVGGRFGARTKDVSDYRSEIPHSSPYSDKQPQLTSFPTIHGILQNTSRLEIDT